MNIPSFADNRNVCLPFVFIGDDAFPLTENLWKPYPSEGVSFQPPTNFIDFEAACRYLRTQTDCRTS